MILCNLSDGSGRHPAIPSAEMLFVAVVVLMPTACTTVQTTARENRVTDERAIICTIHSSIG